MDNLENLIDLIGQRKLSIHDLRTYATIKKEMIIDEPFNLDYRYEPENYVWIKLLRTDDKPAQILSVVLMNWLALSNY